MNNEQISLFDELSPKFQEIYIPNHIEPTKKFKVISLFSGCGGMDLGFKGDFKFLGKYYEKNPFDIVYANDINIKATETYMYNFKNNIECLDIKEKNIDELPKADIVVGGFPCQDFSLSGKRLGFDSERGLLFLEMKNVINKLKPMAFVAENVDGIRRLKKGDDSSALEKIIEEFRSIGYRVVYKALNAKYYGVPQNRVRVIIIGFRNDINNIIKYPLEKYSDEKNNFITSKQAIDDLWDRVDDKEVYNHTSKDYSKAKFYPGRTMQGNVQINPNKPSPTIRAEHHGNIEGHYRSTNDKDPNDMAYWRRLSVRECARLQSFPDDFIFPCSATHAYRQIGNAVPPVMAWHIARALYLGLTNDSVIK